MRSLTLITLALFGCGNGNTSTMDMAAPTPDLTMTGGPKDMTMSMSGDMASGGNCAPDPMMDGQPCGNGCPQGTGTIAVTDSMSMMCNCWYSCTPKQVNSCPCGRICETLYMQTDAGLVPNGEGACIPANGAGERCGTDANKKPFNHGSCQDGTLCVNEDMAGMYAYCVYECTKQTDCPSGTTCLPLQGGRSACIINNAAMGVAVGMACPAGMQCTTAAVCNDKMMCVAQCNGPWDMTSCAMGTKCTAVTDPMNGKISAYVCK